MPLQSVNAQGLESSPSSLLTLITLDSRFISVNGDLYRFHPGVNGLYQPVIWGGQTYTPFPIELSEMQIPGQGTLPRPKLRASNINGFVSAFLRTQGDMVGAKVTIDRVYARYLPHANFERGVNPFGTPDPDAAYESQIYWINMKTAETMELVEWELSSSFEVDGIRLPRRRMNAIICDAIYRDGETCGYTGIPITDPYGKSFTDAAPDGYALTLNARGAYSTGATYARGDWVTVISQADFTFGNTFVYVCIAAGTTGSFNNPQFNSTNWVADGCLHNLLGCDTHFDSPLPINSFPGIARASYID